MPSLYGMFVERFSLNQLIDQLFKSFLNTVPSLYSISVDRLSMNQQIDQLLKYFSLQYLHSIV